MADPTDELVRAVDGMLSAAYRAHLLATNDQTKAMLLDAMRAFPEAAGCGGDFPDRAIVWSLCIGACTAIREADRGGDWDNSDGEIYFECEDNDGNTADPDKASSGDPVAQGRLAAIRLLTAWCNDDQPAAMAIFDATADVIDSDSDMIRHGAMVFTLLDMAGSYLVEWARKNGRLDPEEQQLLRERRKAQNDGQTRFSTAGMAYESIPVDERDNSPDDRGIVAPHGDAVYVVTIYVTGIPGERDRHLDVAHQEIEGVARREGFVLCPERHSEDVEPWQVPHSARPYLRAGLRDVQRRTGRVPQAMRCWRHRGATCPDTAPLQEKGATS